VIVGRDLNSNGGKDITAAQGERKRLSPKKVLIVGGQTVALSQCGVHPLGPKKDHRSWVSRFETRMELSCRGSQKRKPQSVGWGF
jgi:hypothetical protein